MFHIWLPELDDSSQCDSHFSFTAWVNMDFQLSCHIKVNRQILPVYFWQHLVWKRCCCVWTCFIKDRFYYLTIPVWTSHTMIVCIKPLIVTFKLFFQPSLWNSPFSFFVIQTKSFFIQKSNSCAPGSVRLPQKSKWTEGNI